MDDANTPQPPGQAQPRPPWLFTSETARAAKLAGLAKARAARAARAAAAIDNPTPNDAQPSAWVKERITRTRGQLRALDVALAKALEAGNDSRAIERIVSAISRLAEIERKLDGRPDPGMRRPGRDKARPTSPLAGLAAPTPAEADPPQAADAAPCPEPISPSHSEPLSQPDANSQNAA